MGIPAEFQSRGFEMLADGCESHRHRTGILELSKIRGSLERRGRKRHHCDGADHDETDPEPQVKSLVADEARRDALIDYVALLEKQLPGRDGGSYDRDDQEHHIGQGTVRRPRRHVRFRTQLSAINAAKRHLSDSDAFRKPEADSAASKDIF
jgi:hypothetical protein